MNLCFASDSHFQLGSARTYQRFPEARGRGNHEAKGLG
jgi:hypothetical protein